MISFLVDTTEGMTDSVYEKVKSELFFLPNGKYQIDIKKPVRTSLQNKALHKLFNDLAEQMNNEGHTFAYKGFKGMEIEAQWDGYKVKEFLWRPLQKHLLGKESTTQLTTKEIDKVFEPLNLAFAEKGLTISFPCEFEKYLENPEK